MCDFAMLTAEARIPQGISNASSRRCNDSYQQKDAAKGCVPVSLQQHDIVLEAGIADFRHK